MAIKESLIGLGLVVSAYSVPLAASAYFNHRNVVKEISFEGRPVIEYSDERGIETNSFGKSYDESPFGIPNTLITAADRNKDGKAEYGLRIFCVPRRGCISHVMSEQELAGFYEPAFRALRGR